MKHRHVAIEYKIEREQDNVHSYFEYVITIEDQGLMALRALYNLPSDLAIDGVRRAVLKTMGVRDAEIERGLRSQDIAVKITDSIPGMAGLADGNLSVEADGKHFSLNYFLYALNDGIAEDLEVRARAGRGSEDFFLALPPSLHSLWRFAASTDRTFEASLSPQEYSALTKKIYPNIDPKTLLYFG